jgi:hypothetical protein
MTDHDDEVMGGSRSGESARSWWRGLSTRSRRFIIIAGSAEAALKIAALVDLKRRPADQIRGPKLAWVAFVAVVNSVGLAPLSYFAFGRRR